MGKIIKIVYGLLCFILLGGCASALGISSATFSDVEQGRTYTQTVVLVNSPQDFDNHFVIEIDGEIKDWINVSPNEFDLAKGETKQIDLTLEVPMDAHLGEIKGTVTAVGQKTVPKSGDESGGTSVGYAVATKGNIYANVIRQGALASVEILDLEAPSAVSTGSIVKFTATSKNTGNVATSANFKLDIKKDDIIITSIPSTPIDFALNEEKTVKLFWDTQGAEEGKYNAYIEAVTIARGNEKTATTKYEPVSLIVGKEKSGITNIMIFAIGIVIIFIVGFIVVSRKK